MEANGSGPKARLDPRAGKGPALGIGQMRKMVVGKKQGKEKEEEGQTCNKQHQLSRTLHLHLWPCKRALHWALEKELHQTRSCKRAELEHGVLQMGIYPSPFSADGSCKRAQETTQQKVQQRRKKANVIGNPGTSHDII